MAEFQYDIANAAALEGRTAKQIVFLLRTSPIRDIE